MGQTYDFRYNSSFPEQKINITYYTYYVEIKHSEWFIRIVYTYYKINLYFRWHEGSSFMIASCDCNRFIKQFMNINLASLYSSKHSFLVRISKSISGYNNTLERYDIFIHDGYGEELRVNYLPMDHLYLLFNKFYENAYNDLIRM